MMLLDSLTTVLYLSLSVGLLFVSGYGVTRLLLPDEETGLRWIIEPFATAALLMLSCRDEYIFLLPAFGVINWRVVTPEKRSRRWALAPLLLAAIWEPYASRGMTCR